jgi:2-methylisocitrate lyase-like PEP mutase family enzyme
MPKVIILRQSFPNGMDSQKSSTKLRQLINRKKICVAVSAWDCMSAMLVEEAGFDAVDAGSGMVEGSQTGSPDAELGTSTERAQLVSNITDVVDIPVFLDIDSGLGHPVQIMRMIKKLEKAGAAGIYLDDQKIPKGCGHWQNRIAAPLEEMKYKFDAIVEARRDPDFVIIGKVNSLSSEGLDKTLDRAKQYQKWGADIVFVEAPRTIEEMKIIASEIRGTLINVVEGGKTPILTIEQYEEMGYTMVKFCGSVIAALNATKDYLNVLRTERTSKRLLTEGSRYTLAPGFDQLWNLTKRAKFEEYYSRLYTQNTLPIKKFVRAD